MLLMRLLVLLGPSEQLLHCVATDDSSEVKVCSQTKVSKQIKVGKLLLMQSKPLNPLLAHANQH